MRTVELDDELVDDLVKRTVAVSYTTTKIRVNVTNAMAVYSRVVEIEAFDNTAFGGGQFSYLFGEKIQLANTTVLRGNSVFPSLRGAGFRATAASPSTVVTARPPHAVDVLLQRIDPDVPVGYAVMFEIDKPLVSTNRRVVNAGASRWLYAKERDQWVACMAQAMDEEGVDAALSARLRISRSRFSQSWRGMPPLSQSVRACSRRWNTRWKFVPGAAIRWIWPRSPRTTRRCSMSCCRYRSAACGACGAGTQAGRAPRGGRDPRAGRDRTG